MSRLGRRASEVTLGLGLVALATVAQLWVGRAVSGLSVFGFYYPAILAASLIGGDVAGLIALALSGSASAALLSLGPQPPLSQTAVTVDLFVFVASASMVGAASACLRAMLRRRRADFVRLAERELRYRTLFEGVTQGFALVHGVWGSGGELVDLILTDANPALLRMFGADTSALGRPHTELMRRKDPEYLSAHARAFAGAALSFEHHALPANRWFDVRVSRVGENQLAQIVVDVTDRKRAESRQTEMFDELNHRVKNNLAVVSAMLNMQARLAASPELRQGLRKAVDRIQAIGEVHASLYRASSRANVDFRAYLQQLCQRLSTSLLDSERVRLQLTAEPASISLDDAVALGLVVNELVTNAAKYAYPPPAAGVIRVDLRRQEDRLMLTVSDDGQGLPATADSGLGMRLVRSLVQQCHGELQLRSRPGVTVQVSVPAASAAAAAGAEQTRLL